VSLDQPTGATGRRFSLNVVLYVALVLALIACVAGGVAASRRDDIVDLPVVGIVGASDEDLELQEQYADVLEAARSEVQAFINIDYRRMDESIEAVLAGATGKFQEQFDKAGGDLRRILTENKSVMVGKVLSAGVVSIDKDSARVFVGTTATVRNTLTNNRPQGREFRLQVDLVDVDGEWLAADIQFLDGGWLTQTDDEGRE
jgi:Mce-associated membrane protein